MNRLHSRTALAAALILAAWPVARWYAARLGDGSDEPWGLAALAAALWFAPRRGWAEPLSTGRLLTFCALIGGYVATYALLPPLGHALFFVTMLSVALSRRDKFPLAWWALLVLSLPLVATLQFYLGYPLRLAATACCLPLLWLGGLHVTAEGTALHWAGETVIVDAPCSGIQMLWTGLFLAASLACWRRLDVRQSFRLFRQASITIFVANVLRATALFCTETKLWPAPTWAHEGIGLALFGTAAMTIFLLSERLPQNGADAAAPSIMKITPRAGLATGALFSLCLTAAIVPCLTAPRSHAEASNAFPGWAVAPIPIDCANLPLGPREAHFAAGFPGRIGVFSDGSRTYVVRWVRTPTRKLHPASDCLLAVGYSVKPAPILIHPDGSRWGSVTAARGTETLRVQEHIVDAEGREWTDVSAWFWSAALGRSHGPWWAVTVFEAEKLRAPR